MNFEDNLCPLSMSFTDCLIEWILNKSDFHIHLLNQLMKAQNMWHITQFIVIINNKSRCLTVDNDNVCKGRKHVHGSKMQQPFGLFSSISRPGKFEF